MEAVMILRSADHQESALLFMVYFTTMPVPQTIWHRMMGGLMNNEFGRIGMKQKWHSLKYYSDISLE
jgi:hypothetical protein